MAVAIPHARVVSGELDDCIAQGIDGYGVPPNGIFVVEKIILSAEIARIGSSMRQDVDDVTMNVYRMLQQSLWSGDSPVCKYVQGILAWCHSSMSQMSQFLVL